jgi:hypothetical protein
LTQPLAQPQEGSTAQPGSQPPAQPPPQLELLGNMKPSRRNGSPARPTVVNEVSQTAATKSAAVFVAKRIDGVLVRGPQSGRGRESGRQPADECSPWLPDAVTRSECAMWAVRRPCNRSSSAGPACDEKNRYNRQSLPAHERAARRQHGGALLRHKDRHALSALAVHAAIAVGPIGAVAIAVAAVEQIAAGAAAQRQREKDTQQNAASAREHGSFSSSMAFTPVEKNRYNRRSFAAPR